MTRFQLKRRQLLLFLFLNIILPSNIVANQKFETLCEQEILKDKINKNFIKKYCLKAGESALSIENYEDASWFFLLSGEFGRNINLFKNISNIIVYTNIAHSYLLINNLKKSKEYYIKIIQNQSNLNDAIQNDFQVLLKIYPQKSHIIKKGMDIWDKLYEPFLNINKIYAEFERDKKRKEVKLEIEKLSKIIELKNKTIVKEHLDMLMDYFELASLYKEEGFYDKAIENYKESLKIAKKFLNKNHIHIANIYNSLAIAYSENKNFQIAEKYLQKTLKIYKKYYNENDNELAIIYNNFGTIYREAGNYKKAEAFYKKSLLIEKINNSKTIVESYINIGSLYQDMKKWKIGLKYYNKALKIQKKYKLNTVDNSLIYNNIAILYKKIKDYKNAEKFYKKSLRDTKDKNSIENTYDNLGLLYQEIGKYNLAFNYYKKALEIRKKYKKLIDVAISYNILGDYYFTLEDTKKAIYYHKKALNIRKEVLGESSIDTGESYFHLGEIYEFLKDYNKSLKFYKKSLNIYYKILDKNDMDIAIVCNNISSIYSDIGNYKEAEKYISIALNIEKNIFDSNDFELAMIYNNRGSIFEDMKEYNKAINDYKHALNIYLNILGEKSKEVAIIYNNLASLYEKKKNFNTSLKYLEKSKKIFLKISFNQNSSVLSTLYNNLGILYEYNKDYLRAYKNHEISFNIFLKNRDKNFIILDNSQKLNYIKSFEDRISNLLDSTYLYIRNSKKIGYAKQTILNSWLKYKGTIFEYQNILSTIYHATSDKKVKSSIDKLKSLTIQLDNLDNSDIKPKNYKEIKKKIEEQIHNIEVNLSRESQRFKEQLDLKNIDYKEIAKNLKDNQLYIDFTKGKHNYYIFTLDNREDITFKQIDENQTETINRNIKEFLDINKKIAENINNQKLIKELKPKTDKILSKLYKLLIDKNIEDKKEIDRLIISPDGTLNFFPFEALFNGRNYLIEKYTISYISSGREFIRQAKRKSVYNSSEVVLFGSPDFEYGIKGLKSILSPFDSQTYSELDSSREIEVIKRYYPDAKIYQEKNASVKNLMKIKNPKILHLSTHGFFFDDQTILNPMRRSGLALSSANRAEYESNRTGLITALKLSNMELYNTELVVLSACETGLGTIQKAEGVIGLSKAFIEAGARQVIMSLWKVSEEKTALLMEKFYTHVANGEEYALALRNAKLEMIEKHPYYWSAFIISGI